MAEETGGLDQSDRSKKVHSLIDKVYRQENLLTAWERVKENRGSGGVDRQSVAGFEAQHGEQLGRMREELRGDRYQPQPVRQVPIPKAEAASIACWAYQRCTTGCANKHCCNGWNRSLSRYSMMLTTDTGEGGQPRMLSRKCGERSKADGSGLWTAGFERLFRICGS